MITWLVSIGAAVPLLWLLFHQFGAGIAFVIAPVVAVAIAAYRLHLKLLAQKTSQISEASRVHLATVEALASAIDARDQVGVGHVRRTQIYAVGLGRILGLGESDIKALRTGALLHDIGKLAVPDHILNKHGDLTPAELEKAKIHSVVGASILEKVGFDYPVIPTVRYHHEFWDGTGYPDGLKGQEIPLTARIVGVASAFDAMRCARPFRDAMSRDRARQIVQAEAGTRFDPAIVSTLMKNLATLEQEVNAKGLSYDDADTDECAEGPHGYVEQIKLANREVFSLYELAREFSSSLTLSETLDMFTKNVREFVPFTTFALYLLDDAKRTATASHVEGENADLLSLRSIKVGNGGTGYALKRREAIQSVDPDLDFQYCQSALTGKYSTMASVPLIADEELIGAITIYSRELTSYDDEHIRLLETISRIAAEAIAKSLKHDEARTHALTDPMTGLPNARSLQKQFEREAARAGRSGANLQLLMLDLDGFKAVNDTFGHKIGDKMLAEISRVIRGQLRDYDFLARYGGDEFVAIVPELGREDVIEMCDRIEHAVREFRLPVHGDVYASVGISLGSAGYPAYGTTFDQVVAAADKVMYERKVRRKVADRDRRAALSAPLEVFSADPDDDDEGFIIELDETHVIAANAVQ